MKSEHLWGILTNRGQAFRPNDWYVLMIVIGYLHHLVLSFCCEYWHWRSHLLHFSQKQRSAHWNISVQCTLNSLSGFTIKTIHKLLMCLCTFTFSNKIAQLFFVFWNLDTIIMYKHSQQLSQYWCEHSFF